MTVYGPDLPRHLGDAVEQFIADAKWARSDEAKTAVKRDGLELNLPPLPARPVVAEINAVDTETVAKNALTYARESARRVLEEEQRYFPHPFHLALVRASAGLESSLIEAVRWWAGQQILDEHQVSAELVAREVRELIEWLRDRTFRTLKASSIDRASYRAALDWLATLGLLLWNGEGEFCAWRHGAGARLASVAAGIIGGHLLPDLGLNQIFGGGLQGLASEGLITLVIGGPGTGKTSLACYLAVAAMLQGGSAALFSLEESSSAVRDKLRFTSVFRGRDELLSRDSESLIVVGTDHAELEGTDVVTDVKQRTERLLTLMRERKDVEGAPNPGLMCCVLDSLTAYALLEHDGSKSEMSDASARKSLVQLLKHWRTKGVHAVIVSGSAPHALAEQAEYLADNVIELSVEDEQRRIRVVKSRFQSTRPGRHLLHISAGDGAVVYSGDDDFGRSLRGGRQRISVAHGRAHSPSRDVSFSVVPLIWLQTRPWAVNDFVLSDPGTMSGDVMQTKLKGEAAAFESANHESLIWLAVGTASYSHLNIQGSNQFALTRYAISTLLTRHVEAVQPSGGVDVLPNSGRVDELDVNRSVFYQSYNYGSAQPAFDRNARILVLSFYEHPVHYKRELMSIAKGWRAEGVNPQIDCMRFEPSLLDPAMALTKIEERLVAGAQDGLPFTGVLVDSVTNAVLGFPRIAGSQAFWTSLIALAAAFDVTLVSTCESPDSASGGTQREAYTVDWGPRSRAVSELLSTRSATALRLLEHKGQFCVSVRSTKLIRQPSDIAWWLDKSGSSIAPGRPFLLNAE